jgi:hypothetical protein
MTNVLEYPRPTGAPPPDREAEQAKVARLLGALDGYEMRILAHNLTRGYAQRNILLSVVGHCHEMRLLLLCRVQSDLVRDQIEALAQLEIAAEFVLHIDGSTAHFATTAGERA